MAASHRQGRRVRSSAPVQHAASAITAPDTDQLPVYWQFHEAVTRAQLTQWLPSGRHLLVDVSGPRALGAELAAQAGHTVLRVISGAGPPAGAGPARAAPARPGRPRAIQPGRIIPVIADSPPADLPGRRLRRRGHRGRPGAVGAPGRRDDDRRDRPGAARRPGDRWLRRLPRRSAWPCSPTSITGRSWSTCRTPRWCWCRGRTARSPGASARTRPGSCSAGPGCGSTGSGRGPCSPSRW